MAALTQDNRQSILNKVYATYMITGKQLTRSTRSVVSLFDWAGCLDDDCSFPLSEAHKLDTNFVDQLQAAPELASVLFVLDADDELDNDDFAFLIDLESEHRSAITHAWDRFDEMKKLDVVSFRDDLSQRLNRLAMNEGLNSPASTLLAA